VPPFAEAMQQILALIETSDLDGAEAVRASIQRWISAHGGGARLMSPRLAVAWTMVGELGDAAPDLTPAARAALAGAIRGEDLRLARPGVRRGIADQLAVLRARAPTIARALERSEPEVSKTPSGRQGRATLAIPIIVALTVVFRFLAHQEDAPPRYELGSDELRRSTSIPASFDGMAADSIKIRDLSLVRGGPALGAAAVAMARASRARDCAGLQAAAPELHRLASAADGKDADTSEVKLEIKSIAEGLMRTIAERCSSPASSSTP
jgi:hypothetical protein